MNIGSGDSGVSDGNRTCITIRSIEHRMIKPHDGKEQRNAEIRVKDANFGEEQTIIRASTFSITYGSRKNG